MKRVDHEIEPFYDKNSKVLILGTIPSPKSRETGFYYAHPQNRFWKVISDILGENEPITIEDKKNLLKVHKIALWDVLESCLIEGASDSSIKNAKPNNIKRIIENSNVEKIFVTGKTAEKLYNKYCLKDVGIQGIYLPSTSPANCAVKYEELKEKFLEITKYI